VDCIQLVQNRVSQVQDSCQYCHVLSANRDEVSNGNSIYWTLTLVSTNNYDSLTSQTPKITVTTACIKSSPSSSSRCLVAVSNGGSSPSSKFSNCPRPQLPTSHNCNPQLTQQVKVKVTLRLAVYRQSVRLGAKPLEDHDPCGVLR
jgi:hypothetical protein